MDPLMLVLRLFHVVAGALWFGSAFLFTGFLGPSAAETAPASGAVMHGVIKKRRGAEVIKWLAITTVVAGWLLWVRNALLYPSIGEWVTSSFGIVLTIGGLAATAAAYFGITGIGNNVEKLVSIGDEVGASGGPPTPEQGAEMARLGAEIQRHSKVDIVLLFIAVIAMATARYW